ncbi:hypothetical protein JAAARDRAFT_70427 [Jaapia argillacea MUCL 33604]|uniref:Major facilitator superfamily (MFS) profile domain-containing protein n=1 Tax=Jaapia argillacea MUCL 33604 TaxID=933084 RepID=A0A067PPK3_9AGAM|nr:hypothetical protein JAAARDRAFT_70427 [Jaapia argillacea MUCL 33604]
MTGSPSPSPDITEASGYPNSSSPPEKKGIDDNMPSDKSRDDAEGELTYPEGGWKAYSVVLGSFLSIAACFGMTNSLGALEAQLAAAALKDYSRDHIGWIFGVYAFISFFGGIQIGPMFDAYGPRWLMVSGSVTLISGVILFSVSTKYWHFMLTLGILCGVGTSLLFTPSVAAIGHWSLRRRGELTGIAATGGSIGGIVFPLLIQHTAPKMGFGWSLRIVGFVMIPLCAGGILLVRGRTEIFHSLTPRVPLSEASPISEKSSASSQTEVNPRPERRKAFGGAKIDLTAFKDPRFALTTIGVFMIEWGIFIPLTYLTSHAISIGISQTLSYQLLAILNAGSVFGRWFPGLLADRMGRFNTMILTTLFCSLTVFGFWLSSGYAESHEARKALLIVFALCYGFGSGTGIGLTPVCVGQICSTQDYGKRYGTCYFIVSFGALTGIPIAGAILSVDNGQYFGLIMFCGATYIAALGFFVAARIVGAGWRLKTIY